MAESNQEPMSIEAFRAKKAAGSTFDKPTASSSRKVSSNSSKSSPSSSSSNTAAKRPASASRTDSGRRSASVENLAGDRYGPALDQRQSKVKLLREQQAEERRRKNEERRAAFEERKRKKEEEEKERWSSLKEQATKHSVPKANTSALKPGSGRKLPTVPSEGAAKRPGSAVETPSRPSSLPKPLTRPVSANPAKSPSRSSADSLSGGSTPKESPATTPGGLQPKTSLGGGKSVSASNLHTEASRRSSGGSLQQRPSSGTKSRTRTSSTHALAQSLDKRSSRNSASHESLLPPGGKLTKSHSTSSIHRVGHHKPAGEKTHKTEAKPKAGLTDEATAKQALAERRKKAREEAERQAALDKERQEAERLKKEEEERIRAEEEAKEEARMRELAELLRKQEEERLQKAAEEQERKRKEEAEKAAAEKKHKEEEEKRVKEEEERKAKEDEERRKQEEAARLERKRRVEQIMSRTRQTASPTTTEESNTSATGNETNECDPDNTKRKVNEILQKVKGSSGALSQMEDNASALESVAGEEQGNYYEFKTVETVNDVPGSINIHVDTPDYSVASSTSSAIELDPDDTKRRVNEILQKVKGTTGSQNALNQMEDSVSALASDAGMEQENNNELKTEGAVNVTTESSRQSIDDPDSSLSKSMSDAVHTNGVHSSALHGVYSESSSVHALSSSPPLITSQQESSYTVMTSRSTDNEHEKENLLFQYDEESSVTINKEDYVANGTDQNAEATVRLIPEDSAKDHSENVTHDLTGDEDEEALWSEVESTMKARESYAIETLENLGVVAEGDDDEDSEEGQLWKMIEGKAQLAEVV